MNSIDPKEVEKFSRIADEWWDETGKFKPLHQFNPIRLSHLRRKIEEKFSRISGVKILDVGCGGGLVSEPLALAGAEVVGIDASEKNIQVAKIHAEKSALKIDYQATTAEELKNKLAKGFDVVLALEIIEHVSDPESFLQSLAELTKEGGLIFVATMNRNLKSLALAKIAVEYLLRWLPIGTHDWRKFLKPSEINSYAKKSGLQLRELRGFHYNIFNSEWKEVDDLSVNYVAVFEKR
ncbi:MAG: bifunctional 2-polyprenyl-6-hydroxyphenol methylase/3-demethylubiquinol 3-O-methyltransferase UbiG [Proteobacteria bacterium]|nr:bifunctional 2-polyprenyl-6-hydroxyphenol methylase/3-demethylubiquinol 3-O-methyltransferase UbiG [Pseudomonadota bacterium]